MADEGVTELRQGPLLKPLTSAQAEVLETFLARQFASDPGLLASTAKRDFFGSKPAAGPTIKALARFEPDVEVPLLLAQL
ncbi:hypothetical protein [Amycolatopsis sp. lyj-84]|uniref:hypothetical protein n=1 Tax=Amycolatopsis sp. lyj-84 TaxID=2789284 RepID=UPI00397DA305